MPRHRKACGIERLNHRCLSYDRCHGLSPKPRFIFRKHWLIRKSRNHAVTILARHILRREHRLDAWILSHKSRQIAKVKSCAIVRTANHPHRQRPRGRLISAKDLAAFNLPLSIQPDQALPHRSAGRR